MPGAQQVDTVATEPAVDGNADIYRFGFVVAAIGLIVPLLVLVGTATRLAAARRETRLAAIRLVGATSRQVNVLAAVDAALGALLGALAGLALFQVVRPALAGVRITESRFFPELIAPHPWQYARRARLRAGLRGLRRAVVAAPGADLTARRGQEGDVAPAAGVAGDPAAGRAGTVRRARCTRNGKEPDALLAGAGLALIMVGLVLAGPWLTMRAARQAARLTRSAATLLAAQRMAADPKAAFRAVSGLVLAVFIGTAIAGIVPAVLSGQQAVAGGALNHVLRAQFARPGDHRAVPAGAGGPARPPARLPGRGGAADLRQDGSGDHPPAC